MSQAEGSVQAILGQLGSRLGNVVGCVALRGSFGREKLPFVEFFFWVFLELCWAVCWAYVGPLLAHLGVCWRRSGLRFNSQRKNGSVEG